MSTNFETQLEWEERMGKEVLDFLRSEIYIDLPFMDLALSALAYEGKEELDTLATEGVHLYFGPERLLSVFKKNELYLKRAYLHTILHCVFAHLWLRGKRKEPLWNLSCDIAVEYVLDHLNNSCTKRILSLQRRQMYEWMDENHMVSAAEIYEQLQESEWNLQALAMEFYVDDHRFWPKDQNGPKQPQEQQNKPQQKWQKIARQMQLKKEKQGKDSDEGQQLLYSQIQAAKERRCYADFLRKFAVQREELHINEDEFDLAYYHYGIEKYGNIPLIEPLETKEEYRIQELVIVVDTSYSTSGELVQGFLNETFSILKQKQAFFSKFKVHVIQCDEQVQQDIEITNEKQMDALIQNFAICGGGNTDFRPAFSYVKDLKDAGKLKNLGGLLYFTDGKGIYPKKKPDYKVAFLFLDQYEKEKVPAWAMELELEKEELYEYSAGKGRN